MVQTNVFDFYNLQLLLIFIDHLSPSHAKHIGRGLGPDMVFLFKHIVFISIRVRHLEQIKEQLWNSFWLELSFPE